MVCKNVQSLWQGYLVILFEIKKKSKYCGEVFLVFHTSYKQSPIIITSLYEYFTWSFEKNSDIITITISPLIFHSKFK